VLSAIAFPTREPIGIHSFTIGAMKTPWWAGALLAVLVASGCKSDKCTPAQKAADKAVADALDFTPIENLRLGDTAAAAEKLDDPIVWSQQEFNDDLDLLEQGMGCRQDPNTCCARMAKDKREQRTLLAQIAVDVKTLKEGRPDAVAKVMADFFALLDKAEHISLDATPVKEREAWCNDVRTQIARVRQEAPPLWARAIDDAKKHVTEAQERVAEFDRRVAALRAWKNALATKQPITIGSDFGTGKPAFEEAKLRVAQYQAACRPN
jgi:hypothetical protein